MVQARDCKPCVSMTQQEFEDNVCEAGGMGLAQVPTDRLPLVDAAPLVDIVPYTMVWRCCSLPPPAHACLTSASSRPQ